MVAVGFDQGELSSMVAVGTRLSASEISFASPRLSETSWTSSKLSWDRQERERWDQAHWEQATWERPRLEQVRQALHESEFRTSRGRPRKLFTTKNAPYLVAPVLGVGIAGAGAGVGGYIYKQSLRPVNATASVNSPAAVRVPS